MTGEGVLGRSLRLISVNSANEERPSPWTGTCGGGEAGTPWGSSGFPGLFLKEERKLAQIVTQGTASVGGILQAAGKRIGAKLFPGLHCSNLPIF